MLWVIWLLWWCGFNSVVVIHYLYVDVTGRWVYLLSVVCVAYCICFDGCWVVLVGLNCLD